MLVPGSKCVCSLFTQSADFASHLLSVLLCNTLLYIVVYLAMKLLHGERPRWYAWLYLAAASAAWAPGLYFFVSGSTDWYRPHILLIYCSTITMQSTCYVLMYMKYCNAPDTMSNRFMQPVRRLHKSV